MELPNSQESVVVSSKGKVVNLTIYPLLRGGSTMVEHLTADSKVKGSKPGANVIKQIP